MAICNLFNQQLSSATGNFLMFSQYVEDITRNYTEGDNWKIVPTKFVALDIDYGNAYKPMIAPNADELTGDILNAGIPRYFQNCFENACAYGRNNKTDWTAETSRNLFWNFMFDGRLMNERTYSSDTNDYKYVPEVVYYGDINMHSYNEHKGMGYGEIYCYIPTDAERMTCQVNSNEDRNYDMTNNSMFLEGFYGDTTKTLENYTQAYDYDRSFSMSFDDKTLPALRPSIASKYDINTIVVLYSIFNKLNGNWKAVYSDIPMGMYIAGMFDEDCELSNTITKHVSTSYGTGTSYGLRICTRFYATSNGQIINSDIIADDNGYSNMCQLMTAMNENLSRMLDISKSAINTTLSYKETLAAIKNNRTNVPYVKEVNGTDCWFVNGKFVTTVKGDNSCIALTEEAVQQRIDNLKDNDKTNDWTPILEPNDNSCTENKVSEIVDYIRNNFDPNFEFVDESGNLITNNCNCIEIEIATDEDVIGGITCGCDEDYDCYECLETANEQDVIDALMCGCDDDTNCYECIDIASEQAVIEALNCGCEDDEKICYDCDCMTAAKDQEVIDALMCGCDEDTNCFECIQTASNQDVIDALNCCGENEEDICYDCNCNDNLEIAPEQDVIDALTDK